MTSSQVLSVKAGDNYVKNFTYAQVMGNDLAMYDPATISPATPTQPVTTILAYALNGTSTNLHLLWQLLDGFLRRTRWIRNHSKPIRKTRNRNPRL